MVLKRGNVQQNQGVETAPGFEQTKHLVEI
jgi:hypothetical protein